MLLHCQCFNPSDGATGPTHLPVQCWCGYLTCYLFYMTLQDTVFRIMKYLILVFCLAMGVSSKTYLVETEEVTYLIGDFGNQTRDIMLFSSMLTAC